MNPYIITIILYGAMAVVVALGASLSSFGILDFFHGLRWLRIHFVTLGLLTQIVFAVTPMLVAKRQNKPKPKQSWAIWLVLNIGFVILLSGIPIVHGGLILGGGSLIFAAVVLLVEQLRKMSEDAPKGEIGTAKFYITGLLFLLVGITIGTGLWLGWGSFLKITNPLETHIHANNWGFMSLIFGGLLIDVYPKAAGRKFAWPKSIDRVFWLMTFGAIGLTLGPWTGSMYLTVPGLVLHLTATIGLILNITLPVVRAKTPVSPGVWHLITAYLWILAPILMSPFILLGVPNFPGAGIEANAPQALIYGWVFQFGYAVLPYFFRRMLLPEDQWTLGGNWTSLILVHLGGLSLWASIFFLEMNTQLHALAYLFWFASAVPIVRELWQVVQQAQPQES